MKKEKMLSKHAEEISVVIRNTQQYVKEYYHEHEFSIFDVPRGMKKPKGTWKEYQKTRMAPAHLQVFNTINNIAIVTGELSGIIVMDVDGDEGFHSLAEHGITYDMLKEFPHVSTGKVNGYHFYFKYPADGREYRNLASIIPKVDVRAEGGYVMAPPSLHPDGRSYTWVKTLDDSPIVEMPDFLAKLILKAKTSRRAEETCKNYDYAASPIFASHDKIKESIIPIIAPYWIDGQRHYVAMYLAGFLWKNGVNRDKIEELVRDLCEFTGDADVEDRIKSVDTTFSMAPEDSKGISGLEEYLDTDSIEKLKKFFQTSAYFYINDIGFDNLGIYRKDDEHNKIYVAQGRFNFLFKRIVHGTSDTCDHYHMQLGNKPLEVTIHDLPKPSENIYKIMTRAGVEVTQTGCKKICDLINACLANLEYPTYHFYSSMGWVGDQIVVPNLPRKNNILDNEGSFDGWNVVSGDKQKLIDLFKPESVNDYPALFAAIGHVVISPFMILLSPTRPELRSSTLNLVGEKGTGKSTIAKGAMAFYGNPERIKHHWQMTQNAFEVLLDNHKCMPVYFDEIMASNVRELGNWIYVFDQKKGKNRSWFNKSTGELKVTTNKSWFTNIISTGEDSLAFGVGKGIEGRIIEIRLPGTKYAALNTKINDTLGFSGGNQSFGHGIKKIVDLLEEDPANKGKLLNFTRDAFDFYRNEINRKYKESLPDARLCINWAMIAAGYELMCHLFDLKIDRKWILEMVDKSVEEVYNSDEYKNDAISFHQRIIAFYYANRHRFADTKADFFNMKNQETGRSYIGYVTRKDGKVYISFMTGVMAEITKDMPTKHTGIMRATLIEKGLMIANDKAKGLTRVKENNLRASFYTAVLDEESSKHADDEDEGN